MLFVCWYKFGSIIQKKLSKSRIFSMGISMMEFLCSYTIVILAHISFMSLLNNVDGVGSVGAWVEWVKRWQRSCGSRESTKFWRGSKIVAGVEILMCETHNFINFYCDSMKFYCFKFTDYSLYSAFSVHTVFELSTQLIFHYFTEKVLFPKIKRLNQHLKSY